MDKLRVDCAFEIKAVSDDGRIEGHGAVFGNIDFGMDRIEKGAFRDWLRTAKEVPMLWQHNTDEPIGVWDSMREDTKGLKVSGQLNLSRDSGQADVPVAWQARALAKQGAVTGLSIGYFAKDYRYEDDVRVLEKLDVIEVSLATFPMNDRARVTGVKHYTRIEMRNALRQRFGLSWMACDKLLDEGFEGLVEPGTGSLTQASAVFESMKQRNAKLRAALGK